MKRGLGRVPGALAIAAVLSLALPALASAADTYADASAADNSGDCLTPAAACKTIGGTDGALAKAGTGDSVFVEHGTYAESLTVGAGKSLVAADPSGPQPVIDNGTASSPTITIDGTGAGSIDGLTIRSDFQPLYATGPATIVNNRFDENNVPSFTGSDVFIDSANAALVMNNVFSDPDLSGLQTGVLATGAVTPTISSNTFSGFQTAIEADSSGVQISDNQISSVHSEGATAGVGVSAVGGDPRISGNTITAPLAGSTMGIWMQSQSSATGDQISRNEISGYSTGVRVSGESVTVSLSDDLIHGNSTGLRAAGAAAGGSVLAQGVTFSDTVDIRLDSSSLTLNSSIVMTPIVLTSGTESCDISYSRGTSTAVANGCSNFSTTASPQFVAPLSNDFRLQPNSPMIDAGDPTSPGLGAVDFYGNPRAVQGFACDGARRDIGAVEYQPPATPQCNQDTYADVGSGSDDNNCTSQLTPCQTIAAALAKSTSNHTTYVADGTYSETPVLSGGRSLIALDSSEPEPVIDGNTSTTITVDSSGAGTVSGLHILSSSRSIDINGKVTVDGNTLDEDPASTRPMIQIESGSSVVISHNTLVDPDAAGFSIGVLSQSISSPAPVVSSNTFTGLGIGVESLAGDSQITDNEISGAHPLPSSALPGAGILVGAGNPTIARNTISDAAASPSVGVFLYEAGASTTGANLRGNTISGSDIGLEVTDTEQPVSLSEDLIYGNSTGIETTDSNGDAQPDGQGDATVTDETIYDNTVTDVRISHTDLTLDSSAIESPIQLVGGTGTCHISYSRGPSTSVANGCSDFDTTDDPEFVDSTTGDYRLLASSPLIDRGDPGDPGPGVVDHYGNPRAVQGLPCDAERRDIGAAEYLPGSQPECAQATYADAAAANDNGNCTSAGTACRTITAALAKAAPGQTTYLAQGTYRQSLILDGGRSLAAFDTTVPKPIVNAPTGQTAIDVPVGSAGSISGLRIRSDSLPLEVEGPVTITGNAFDSPDVSNQADVDVDGATGVTISNNQFQDPDLSGVQIGVRSSGPDTMISGNTFSGLAGGVEVLDGSPVVSGNQVTGTHPIGSTAYGSLPGAGILALNSDPTISANTVSAPSAHPATGIYVRLASLGPPVDAGAAIDHNRLSGNDAGVQVIDSDQPVTLSNDLIYGNTVGLAATDSSADSPPSNQGNVSVSDETFDNGVDVQLSSTALALDSSVIETPIDLVGGGSCSISYSRGPAAGAINGCGSFATNAAPQFVNPGSGDYHLQSSSALIDTGNPSSPAGGATDFYGGSRELQGKACSSVRRDIGAAEFNPGATPGCTPPTSPPSIPKPPSSSGGNPGRPKLTRHPKRRGPGRKASFRYASDIPRAHFLCKLDRGSYKSCPPRKTYRRLHPGRHVFRVVAVSAVGKKSVPCVFRFVLKRKP